jgi:hypothetical protein
MKQFTPLLKSINERLDLPQPTKSRIILEIAADLNDLYQLYLCRGLNEQQAAQRAEEKFDLTDEALNELTQLHQSLFRRLMDRISEQAQTQWERVTLFLVLLFVVALGSKFIFTTQFVLQASKFILPILGLFFGIIIISLIKSYQFYIIKNHNVKLLQKGLPAILYLGGANLFLGIFGYITELYSTTRTMMYSGMFDVIITVLEHGDPAFFNSVERVMKCASMAMVCTLVTILTALIWFILINKVKKIELAEAAFLLED